MGMFIKFDDEAICNWCDREIWECTCGRNTDLVYYEPAKWSTTNPSVTQGDIICSSYSSVTQDFQNQAYVKDVDGTKIFVTFLDGRNDGTIVEWPYDTILRLSNAIGEYEK